MREIFTSGSVGRALGNQCLYLELDREQRSRLFKRLGAARQFNRYVRARLG